ncbi:hypothetical protein U6A24_09915 [Aquimarina gracilis]|uniref:DUF4304 domain-containing protein n=1 Tax=Aquimarina gracilis TaxID=874422 RepID=A0ABU5ZUT2_9FLAO|nr:hypothetical protein [Aquimarina gracilis]MEB3345778.1 hypothetical protein [Aquimarina gracilis]
MKYSETKRLLNNAFKGELAKYGYKKFKYGFERTVNNKYYRCGISVFDYRDYQQASFIFSIGLIPLSRVMMEINGQIDNPNVFKPSHFNISQEGLYDNKIFDRPDFTIYNESHIENMVHVVMGFMEKRGFTILEEKSTLSLLEEHINLELPHNQNNKSNGLVLAKLLDKDYYHELLYKYCEIVDTWEVEQYKEDFYKVVEFLKTHTRDDLIEIAGITEEDLV